MVFATPSYFAGGTPASPENARINQRFLNTLLLSRGSAPDPGVLSSIFFFAYLVSSLQGDLIDEIPFPGVSLALHTGL